VTKVHLMQLRRKGRKGEGENRGIGLIEGEEAIGNAGKKPTNVEGEYRRWLVTAPHNKEGGKQIST